MNRSETPTKLLRICVEVSSCRFMVPMRVGSWKWKLPRNPPSLLGRPLRMKMVSLIGLNTYMLNSAYCIHFRVNRQHPTFNIQRAQEVRELGVRCSRLKVECFSSAKRVHGPDSRPMLEVKIARKLRCAANIVIKTLATTVQCGPGLRASSPWGSVAGSAPASRAARSTRKPPCRP